MKKNKKNICYLLGGNTLSGAEKRIIITAINLSKNSQFQVKLITSNALKEEFLKSELHTLEHSKMEWISRASVRVNNRYIRGIFNLIKNTTLNIFQLPIFGSYIHIVLFNNLTILSIIPSRLIGNSKYFFEITSPDVARSKAVKTLIKYKFISNRLICVSESVENKLCESSPSRVYIRQQPLAYAHGDTANVSKENLVIFAHRLIKRKNPMLAVKAFKILASKYPKWSFYICGDGKMKEEVETSVSSAKLPNFIYKGYVYDMDRLMKKSKIFVSLTEPDNYPSQSVFSAMANGNALIVGNTGLSKEKFIKNNGYAVDLTVNSVINAIEKTINEENFCKLSKNSLSLFKSKYRQELYIEENINIYN